jgi:hypothetical protein
MLASFFHGLVRASRHWRIILLLLVANILISIPVVVPFFLLIAQTSSERLAANAMLADKLDLNWMTDLINERFPGESLASLGGQMGALLLVMGVSYLLLNTLFAGGILEVFASQDGRFAMRRFWAGCGAYFWRFFRLLLISLLFYGAAYFVYFLISKPIDAAAKQAATFTPVFYRRWAASLLLLLLFAFVNMIFDYAKIGAVVGDRRGMFRETIRAVRFGLRNFFRAYSLYWLIGLVGLGLFALLAWLRGLVNQRSILAVLLATLLAQAAMAARMWTRLAFFAGELDLYRRLAPVVVPVRNAEPHIEFAAAEVGQPVNLPSAEEAPSPQETELPRQAN